MELWDRARRTHILIDGSDHIATSGTSATISNLEPGTRYTVIVRAVSDGILSQEGRARVATERFAAVRNLHSTVGTATMTLTWTASPFPEVTDYEVIWLDGRVERPVTDIPGALLTFPSNTSAVITGLEAPNRFTFVVRALYNDGVHIHKSLNARVVVRLR